MTKSLKSVATLVAAGANVAVVLALLLAGYSDRISPEAHPYAAISGLAFPAFLAANVAFLLFWAVFRRRFCLLPVAGMLAVYPPLSVYLPLNSKKDLPPGAFKVMSFNVMAYAGKPGQGDAFEKILNYLRQSDADIVCLQEAIYGWRDAKPRFDSLYAYHDTTMIGHARANAVGIYTRFPIIKEELIAYDSRGNGSAAYFLLLNGGGDTVIVVNNHFESNHLEVEEKERYAEMIKGEMEQDSARQESRRLLHKLAEAAAMRAPQARAVGEYIAAHSQYPIIVCGDFNDSPLSYTRRTVAKGLTDCFAEAGSGLGFSFNQKGFFVRIDNILCSKHFDCYNCKVDNGIDISDHFPISCYLKTRAKP